MTQYLLSVWHSPNNPIPTDPAVMQQAYEQVDAFNAEIQAKGVWVFGGGLHAPESATVVRVEDGGEPIMTDGPFAETKEQLGGFWIIEADDLDAALAWAAKGAAACMGPVEVRPFQDEPPQG
jgi:hypothetical protein